MDFDATNSLQKVGGELLHNFASTITVLITMMEKGEIPSASEGL
jgi:hypothetical protein